MTRSEHRNTFAGNPLDREAANRRDVDWIRAQLAAPDTRFLPLRRLETPVIHDGEELHLAWSPAPADPEIDLDQMALLLGTSPAGGTRFAIDATDHDEDVWQLPLGARQVDLRAAAATLHADDCGIAAQARSLVDWHARHGHCAVCGAETAPVQGGISRTCVDADCRSEHFPRTDPVVITLVIDNTRDRCLLGRQSSWPPGMFSALAGFIDHGESIEDAVRREVAEEAGIQAINVRYHSSQPWPFPASLMIGCHAEAASAEIDYDDWEMDDVRWFTRTEIRESMAGPAAQLGQPGRPGGELSLPGPMAIAHTLISAWADGLD